jgi:hypothetical protein
MPIIRQTPGGKGIWGNCHFFVDDDTKECDWWVVFEGLDKKEKVKCPAGNTIFITGEPESIKKYNQKFINQFSYVITGRQDIKHKNIIRDQQALPWMAGISFDSKNKVWQKDTAMNYDDLFKVKPKKEKLISVISSNKAGTVGHKKRLKFVSELKKVFGDELDVFGRGLRDVADKWEAIAPYKYHIALENSAQQDYWTEKLADAFLAESYPIYYGCPNIYKYFPKNSLTTIDIYKTRASIKAIKKIITDNKYNESLKYIKTAKNLILNKYNLFPFICNIIKEKNSKQKIKSTTLYPVDKYIAKHKLLINKLKKYV